MVDRRLDKRNIAGLGVKGADQIERVRHACRDQDLVETRNLPIYLLRPRADLFDQTSGSLCGAI